MRALRNFLQPPDQIARAIKSAAVHVVETDEVGKIPITKEDRNAVPLIRLIQSMALVVVYVNSGLGKDSFVRSHPLKAFFCRKQRNGVGYGALRGPEAARIASKAIPNEFARTSKLSAGILRKAHFDRHAIVINAAVDQQRKNRMVERRGRDLDHPLCLLLPVFGNHGTQSLQRQITKRLLVRLTEVPAFLDQFGWTPVMVHPGKCPPRLNVAKIF